MDTPVPPASGTLLHDHPCIKCSYNLIGLSTTGVCPECGTDVARSLRGDLLFDSSPAYVATLHRGALLIIGAIITSIVIAVFTMIMAFVYRGMDGGVEIVINLTQCALTMVSLYGYWCFSEPDPGQLSTNLGEKPRRFMRISILCAAGSMLLMTGMQVFLIASGMKNSLQSPMGPNAPGFWTALILVLAVSLIGLAAWLVQFIATMRYSQWLAPRLPNEKLHNRAKLYIWLLPVIYLVGLCLVGLGPLVAMVLYILFFNTIRSNLADIMQKQRAAGVYG